MSRLPLAVLLLALAPSARADSLAALKSQAGPSGADAAAAPTASVSAKEIPFPGCDEKQQQRMRAAIDGAMKMVDSCLSTYNKGVMARDIKRDFPKFRFSCAQEMRASGGETVREPTTGPLKSADISMTMHTRMSQYSLEARVFHEMIHAVDGNPNQRYIVSPEFHKTAGFPDPVYGCQFTCYGGVYDDERKAMVRYLRQLGDGADIPASDRKVDCDNGQDCGTLEKYVYLCDTAKPVVTKEVKAAAHKGGAPKCIAEGLLNGCDSINDVKSCGGAVKGQLCAVRCKILQAQADNGGQFPDYIVNDMLGLGARLEGATQNDGKDLAADEKKLFDDRGTKKLIKSCN